ncbi:MAG: type II toxin-antitoxin system VapC family toxin [Mariprofundaceae bacterium]|nr:type II toxin-antitoxin system VapC family toxin [Mariprofundaceae bacterium]
MYVLDTNTLIYYFKGMGNVADKLLQTAPRDIAIPAVVLYELEVGLAKSNDSKKRREQLDDFIALITVLPMGIEEAKAAANIRAALEVKGTPIGAIDTLIAGIALANQGVLVTHNTKEFSRVQGLMFEDWF